MNSCTNSPLSFADALAMAAVLQSPAPRVDAEHLLMFVTGYDRVYFYTWPDRLLAPAQAERS